MISEELLIKYGAEQIPIKKREILFRVATVPRFFFQMISGKMKMNNYNEDGKEFIQGIFTAESSFGEPPLLAGLLYPAQAEAIEDSMVWRLEKESFLILLKENPDAHIALTQRLANRLHYKATMVAEISTENPEHRLLKLIDYFKEHIHKIPKEDLYYVELSRQQMADLTGLRVETVIRAIKSLEKRKILQLISHKIVR